MSLWSSCMASNKGKIKSKSLLDLLMSISGCFSKVLKIFKCPFIIAQKRGDPKYLCVLFTSILGLSSRVSTTSS